MARTFVIVSDKISKEINNITDAVCKSLEIDNCKLCENSTRKYYDARYLIVYLVRKKFEDQVPYKFIGKIFCRENHLFALQAERKCKDLLSNNVDFKRKYEMVVNMLSGNVNLA